MVLSKGKYKYQKANMVTDQDLEEVRKLLDVAEGKIRQVRMKLFSTQISSQAAMLEEDEAGNAIQGVFDGENMVGTDKKMYSVPANYASKSKLIPGDVLKLNIVSDGKFLFKQIGPVSRKNLIGVLEEIDSEHFQVDVGGKKFRVLLASITYFKAKPGDKLSVVVPTEQESAWAAVDNII
ncbi:hypothetical protein A2215_01935 [Candidatus Berkelbacteria bacterium RIFOXYA2_FULL_43_10]|uniref:50S ribosomal protein L7/L12 n=1 Tax=Candidatus Berkelbacteria bacterium RIFOXYA2_FULL_43_10 TaxID=1797472 RepID=A0A1F5E7B8_9BACT|nr:MAG: hypothetical protein A2215_01935 [Candidatus Berkelbacteria bacterium RIFOXYA2_FULL_43_10]